MGRSPRRSSQRADMKALFTRANLQTILAIVFVFALAYYGVMCS